MRDYTSTTILIAKNERGLEVGIGVFHKEFELGEYICDYVLAHEMHNFLNLTFNFSRFIFENDSQIAKVEYIFSLKHVDP